MKLVEGIYDQIINEALDKQIKERIGDLDIHKDIIDYTEAHEKLSFYLATIASKGLKYYKSSEGLEKQINVINKLIKNLSVLVEDPELEEYCIGENQTLKSVMEKSHNIKPRNLQYPMTSISKSSLFTGAHYEPTVVSELRKEIASADEIDLLISFVKFSGLRLIMDTLKEHTLHKRLRIITTSYMGASDFKAIEMLSRLPNTEIKISYDTERTRLHAKAYYFHRESGYSTAYIGSSNLSKAALTEGTEWNLKVSEYTSADIIEKYRVTFETYWNGSEFKTFNPNDTLDITRLKTALKRESGRTTDFALFDIKPYGYQQEILDHLEVERSVHNSFRNLIVAATGTGKTVVAAFDFKEFLKSNPECRMLFIAHRKEILEQSILTFRGVLKDHNFGDLWVGEHVPSETNNLFVSIQTLNVEQKYLNIPRDKYDYIVFDETHHGAAQSYVNILNHFEPKILLGMTATPERMDGKNILEHFNDRIAYEIRLSEAIDRGLLCPFHYFGITDKTDLSSVKWTSGKYDLKELELMYIGDDRRVQLIVDALNRYVDDLSGVKAIGFCVSQSHARFMSERFNRYGLKSYALDSNSSIDERRNAKRDLEKGSVQFVFVVDLYNEGVDIPSVNTVLFLRPTESATVFVQQLGRGLRITDDKEVLTVLDFVGQANKMYNFRLKYHSLIGKGSQSLEHMIEKDFPILPKGSFIHLERKAKEHILENIRQTKSNKRNLLRFLRDLYYSNPESVNLKTFIKRFNLDINDLYRKTTFTELCHHEGLIEEKVEYPNTLSKRAFYRLSMINSMKFITFSLDALRNGKLLSEYKGEDQYLALMLYYTLFDQAAEVGIAESFNQLFISHPVWIKEMVDILEYNKEQIDFIEKDVVLGYQCPLELYAQYTSDQVLSALGEHSEVKKKSFREGVLHVKDRSTDIFFITLNKSEKEFSSSTLYEDYAISEKLFHWQSQSRTSELSPTGQRYIHQRENGNKVLIFVRNAKMNNGYSLPYYFLGPANYVSHKGSKPISIIWELENPIPSFLLKDVNKIADIV